MLDQMSDSQIEEISHKLDQIEAHLFKVSDAIESEDVLSEVARKKVDEDLIKTGVLLNEIRDWIY
jgi:nicotinate-nucleotide pyrophosphorylase